MYVFQFRQSGEAGPVGFEPTTTGLEPVMMPISPEACKVRIPGVEPGRARHCILSAACLPVPAYPLIGAAGVEPAISFKPPVLSRRCIPVPSRTVMPLPGVEPGLHEGLGV